MSNQDSKFAGSKPFVSLLVLIVVAALSFYGGLYYQKHHETSSGSNNTVSGGLGRSGFGGARFSTDRVIGSVTAISPTSISVQNSRTGAMSTLAITSSTQITDNGQTVTTSDIQTGDTVLVIENSSNTTQASSIVVNPSFGGFGGGSGAQNSSGTPD